MKARIKKTGEIIYLSDISKSSLDGYGVSLEDIELQFNHKSNKSDTIDWERERIEISKAVIQGFLSNPANIKAERDNIIKYAIGFADALIAELKKR